MRSGAQVKPENVTDDFAKPEGSGFWTRPQLKRLSSRRGEPGGAKRQAPPIFEFLHLRLTVGAF
jgi:hypothetical protein